MVLDCAYSLEQIRDRGLEHVVTQLDLGGFFDHVWYVQPLLGAGACAADEPIGPARTASLSEHHTVVEAPIARLRLLRRLAALNLVLAQLLLFGRLSRLLRRRDVRAIAVADPFYLGLWGVLLSRVHRLPLIVRINANYDATYAAGGLPAYPRLLRWHRLESAIARLVFARAALVTVGSDDNRQYVIAHGARPERIGVVPTGDMIARVHLQPPDERPSVRAELGVGDRPLVVFVGRLDPSKHPAAALLVLARLKADFPDAALVIVGDGWMRLQLELQARELEVAADVIFVGVRDQSWIARAFSSADVALSPYSGLALVEAALAGSPIVGYDVEWHAEFVASGENGILVRYGDVDALADAAAGLLRDPARARALGRAARGRALREMDPAEAVAIKRSVYAAVCASEGASQPRRPARRTRTRSPRRRLPPRRGPGSG